MSAWPSNHAARRRRVPLIVRVYALLLWLYPAPFRREYGEEMLCVLRDRVRDTRGSSAVVWLWGWALGDLLRSALAERMRAEVPMDAKVWSRVAGAAAILGGVVVVVVQVILALPVYAGSGQESTLTLSSETVANSGGETALYVLAPVLFLFVALVLTVRLWGRAPRLVAAGLALVFLGTLMGIFGQYEIQIVAPRLPLSALFNMSQGTPTTLEVILSHISQYGQVPLILGFALLGVALLRVRLLLRGSWLLMAVALLTLLYFVTTVPGSSFHPAYFVSYLVWNTLTDVFRVLAGVAWIALGVSLWRGVARPAPVAVANRG